MTSREQTSERAAAASEAQVSPRPWRVQHWDILSAKGQLVTASDREDFISSDADLALIVAAVNEHEALLQCERALRWIGETAWQAYHASGPDGVAGEMQRAAITALSSLDALRRQQGGGV